jgi:signal transduction histidine kinase
MKRIIVCAAALLIVGYGGHVKYPKYYTQEIARALQPMSESEVWFRAPSLAALFALLWTQYRSRVHDIRRQFDAQMEARVEERTRIARELHDTLLQSFHGVLMRFQAAHNLLPERAADARQVLETALDDGVDAVTQARDAVQDLRSSRLIENDLADAVQAIGEELAAQSPGNTEATAFSVVIEGTSQNLHPIVQDEIYRITGEALRNAFRHARARRIEVEIRYDARRLRVRLRDDGIGIDVGVLGQEGRAGTLGFKRNARAREAHRRKTRDLERAEFGYGGRVDCSRLDRLRGARRPAFSTVYVECVKTQKIRIPA